MKMNDKLISSGGVIYTIIATEIDKIENGKVSGKAIVYGDGSRLVDAVCVEDLRNITEDELIEMCGESMFDEYTGKRKSI